jgi:hypothetical protein
MGWHGQKRMWAIKKMDELDALNVTIQRITDASPSPFNGPTSDF